MQNAIINVNGQITAPDQAKVSIYDRGYLYGDSLYEVARTYQGRFFRLREHLERLQISAALCHMTLGQSLQEYEDQIQKTLKAFHAQPGHSGAEVYCRLIVTRGVGKIGFGLNCIQTPTQYVIIVQPLEAPSPAQFKKGLHLQLSQRLRNDPRALDPAMKSGNYLNSLLAYLEAAATGHDDAILLNYDGFVTEGTTFNIFYVRRGIVATPPLDIGILDGITRRDVIQLAENLGYEVRECRFLRERLMDADEVFLTSSIKEVFPITRIDGRKIGTGAPGPTTRKLHEAFREITSSRNA